MLEVVKYSAGYKSVWDAFVSKSKNGTFVFLRDYMEYHAERFEDHSLLFYRKGSIIALLPANAQGAEVHSHGGLGYGGVISDSRMKTTVMLEVFTALAAYYRRQGFTKLLYKAIPHIYHQTLADEDLYALFKGKAVIYRRDVASALEIGNTLNAYNRKRKWQLTKALKHGFSVKRALDFKRFMAIEQDLLQEKYNTRPAHTADEIVYLATLFPEHIKLYAAYAQGEMLAGIIVYETATVAHCQYMATTARGRAASAMDVLICHLLNRVYPHKKYFNFGISTEQQGQYLNEGLIRNKESFGARAVVHDFYELNLQMP